MSDSTTPADHDSPWKEALEHFFPDFLALLFPAVFDAVDWRRAPAFLDKELQKVVRDAEDGRRHADKLIRVHTLEGHETWVLIHVEVQGEPERAFAERMFRYYYRLRDRYAVDVVSLAVLKDDFAARGAGSPVSGRGVPFRGGAEDAIRDDGGARRDREGAGAGS